MKKNFNFYINASGNNFNKDFYNNMYLNFNIIMVSLISIK